MSCYAATIAARFSGAGQPYEGLATFDGKDRGRWTGKVRLVEEKLKEPLHWKKPTTVFVNSMSDLFHEDVPDKFIDEVFSVMDATPRHTYQVLTKRSERMRTYCDQVNNPPLPNVWLGVSVENQKTAVRIEDLLQVPNAVPWVSYEPALEAVDFSLFLRGLAWIVVGGESGVGARPFNFEWPRSVLKQCQDSETKVFIKQMGSNVHGDWLHGEPPMVHVSGYTKNGQRFDRKEPNRYQNGRWKLRDKKGGTMSEWPEDLRVREFPVVSAVE